MQLGRFELGARISAGGMGEVFTARVVGAEGFRKAVAVKRIFPHLAADADYRSMFVREAKLVAGLTHPNIVQVLELGETEDDLYIVMELVQGVDLGTLLARLLDRGQVLTPPLTAVIGFDALDALAHAHEQSDAAGQSLGIVHRDVSPQNLLVSVDGFVKLCDFGLARMAAPSRTNIIGLHGKLPYLAPEQLVGEPATPASDQFSLGVVLFSLLAGRQLFPARQPTRQVELWTDGVPFSFKREELPAATTALVEVVRRMTAIRPETRFASAREARAALEDYLVTASPSAARASLAGLVRELGARSGPVEVSGAPHTQEWTSVLARAAGAPSVMITTPEPIIGGTQPQPLGSPPKADDDVVPPGPAEGAPAATPAVAGTAASPEGAALSLENETTTRVPRRLRSWLAPRWLALGGVLLLGAGVFVGSLHRKTRTVVLLGDIPLEAPGPPASAPAAPLGPQASAPHGAGAEQAEVRSRAEPRRKPSGKRDTPTRAASTATGLLNLNVRPWAKVTIDGQRLGRTTPLIGYPLPAGEHELRLELPDGNIRTLRVQITANQTTTKVVE